MSMNLTGLAELVGAAKGQPLQLALDDISPDAKQPRTEFAPDAMNEIADSIRQRGVKTPISVRPDPKWPGKYIINFGERRYLGSKMAGKTTIPAFVDEDCNSYDQVNENLQRANLTPMELARFIQGRIAAGDTKAAIARGVGKAGTGKNTDASFITHHLALIEPPACVAQAYAAGTTSPRTLYELRALYHKHPQQVAVWCAQGPEITRPAIARLAETLGHDQDRPPMPVSDTLGHDQAIGLKSAASIGSKTLGHDQATMKKSKPASAPAQALSHHKTPHATVAIMVEHDGRRATVHQSSIVRIVYEGSTEIVEVALSEAVVVMTWEVPR
jgi:ParB family chromosome partitioning protein